MLIVASMMCLQKQKRFFARNCSDLVLLSINNIYMHVYEYINSVPV